MSKLVQELDLSELVLVESDISGLRSLSGDLSVINGDVRVLNGNYVQTYQGSENVENYSYRNSFLQAESIPLYGMACTGSRGYCILATYPDLNAVKLSGDIRTLSENTGKKYSYALEDGCDSEVLTISAVDTAQRIVYFAHELPRYIAKMSASTEDEMKWLFEYDDNALYCPRDPSIGNTVIHNFYANHAEGGSVKAIGKYTHAEGRRTIADNRYSHAEGDGTFAGRMAAHAEGQGTAAYGYYSHAEGQNTYVANEAATGHAEGCQTSAFGQYSHAAGYKTCAYGIGSHAEGYLNSALGSFSHAEGDGNCYAGTMSYNIISADDNLMTIKLDSISGLSKNLWIAGGYQAQTSLSSLFGWYIVDILEENTISVNYLPYEASKLSVNGWICVPTNPELGTTARGEGAHVEGWRNFAYTDAHAEGVRNIALGKFSHCAGIANKAGWCSIAIGKGNSALGFESIAMGCALNGDSGTAKYDSNVVNLATRSFAWSGNGKYEISGTARDGTFNINPKNGLSGVWIGEQNLGELIGDIETLINGL